MAVQVTIEGITGTSPYYVYIFQSSGAGCFYIATISTTSYVFDIQAPNNTSLSYMLKIKDAEGCTFNAVADVS